MSWREILLDEILNFYNGKAPIAAEDGEYPIYGSNGVIGNSKEYNHECAVILGRVGAYCGSVEICDQKFWASDNTKLAHNSAVRFSWMPAYAGMTSFPRKRESSLTCRDLPR